MLLQGDSYQCWYQLFSQQFLHLYLDGQELQEAYLICVFVLFWQILLFNWTPEDVLSTRVQFQTQSLLQNPDLKWHTVLLLEVIPLLLVVLGTFGPSMKQPPFSEVDNHVSIWKQEAMLSRVHTSSSTNLPFWEVGWIPRGYRGGEFQSLASYR